MNIDLENELNPKQKKAVDKMEGPALVISGPGAGKTRTITYRTIAMIKKGIDPRNILILTFTNKAASNMKDRIKKKTDTKLDDMWMGTFHATGLKILSKNLKAIGYPSYFVIYDSDDQEDLVEEILNESNNEGLEAKAIKSIINKAKMNMVNPSDFISYYSDGNVTRTDRVIKNIYKEYEKRLVSNAAFDFSDLIKKTIELLESNDDVRKKYQSKFKFVMIDEYQDTNLSQYKMSKILAEPQNNIMAIGDSNQSIYSFRGADIRNILEFEENFPNAEIIKLERNYRSVKNIIEASSNLITNNQNRREKDLWSDKRDGEDIFIVENGSPNLEAEFVTRMIQRLKSQYDYDDMAIFYRSHYLSNDIENSLIDNNIPYTIVGSSQFLDRQEVKFMLSMIKVGINPDDNIALTSIIKMFNNDVGIVTMNRMKKYAKQNSMSFIDVMHNPENVKGIGKKRGESIRDFLNDYIKPIKDIVNDDDKNLYEKVEKIYREYHSELLNRLEGNIEERDENMRELVNFAVNYYRKDNTRTLSDFINYITVVDETEEAEDDEDSVNLMSIHAAKGLEFPVVFTIGMEEGLLPHYRSLEEGDLEEERRLTYVAMTRAEERLFLTYASGRMKFGRWQEQQPSRFLNEISIERTRTIKNYRNSY